MNLFDQAQALAKQAESKANGGMFEEAQQLHGECCDLFQKLLRESEDINVKESLGVLVEYHKRRRSKRGEKASSDAVAAPASLFSPVLHKPTVAVVHAATTTKSAPRTLLSVSVAWEEIRRFGEEFAAFRNTTPPELPISALKAVARSPPPTVEQQEDDLNGFYEISKHDLLPLLKSGKRPTTQQQQQQTVQLTEKEIQQMKRRIQDYMTSEREAFKRKVEEYWTLVGIVRIASQEMEKAQNKQSAEIKLWSDRLKEERELRANLEAAFGRQRSLE